MRFRVRRPSLKRRIRSRTSIKRHIVHRVGIKMPRGTGWIHVRNKIFVEFLCIVYLGVIKKIAAIKFIYR
ncbi:MAG TPA: hypothetical protein VK077_08020 [Virgibacillus sp.]|nr:hypothetical protein [Virgibacillus sp.]